jgi:SAM-dependent methyltransferase
MPPRVTRPKFGSAAAFSESAEAYRATMAPALAPVAAEVVRRAALAPDERVLDIGTGTGTAARLALGGGRQVIGLDAAAGMLDIARVEAPAVELIEADFTRMPLATGSVDVVIAVHALLFASNRVEALKEWRRVTAPGGRLSISVPGPGDVVPSAIFGEVYDRYGIEWSRRDYPDPAVLAQWARDAGWADIVVDANPGTGIPLADDAAFRTWLRVGRTLSDWTPERLEAIGRDLLAISPRASEGGYVLPFGSLYLVARNV